MARKGERLLPRQEAFIRHYLATGVAAEAYRLAGYSPKDAAKESQRLLKLPLVQAAIAAARSASGVLTAEQVLERLSDKARAADKDADQIKALELLGKHHKLFTDKVNLAGADGEPLKVSININRVVPS